MRTERPRNDSTAACRANAGTFTKMNVGNMSEANLVIREAFMNMLPFYHD
jgi:hypothetical protein